MEAQTLLWIVAEGVSQPPSVERAASAALLVGFALMLALDNAFGS